MGCDSVNIYDFESNIINVFQKKPNGTNKFLTTCKMTPLEKHHFETTNGNFLTEKMIYQQQAISTQVQTIVNDSNNNNDNNGIQ